MSWGAAAAILPFLGARYQYERDRNQHRYRVQVNRARARFQSMLSENNAILAEQQAAEVMRTEGIMQTRLDQKAQAAIGRGRVSAAGSGFMMEGGDLYRFEEASIKAVQQDKQELKRTALRNRDLLTYKAAITRYAAKYNEALAGHDPGGPGWGGYLLGAIGQATGSLMSAGMLGGGGGGGGTYNTGAPWTGPHR